ncbi:SH3 domain-containing protein [Desulfobacterota bacterium AH_259_B03_O07]|nr:SH3 domain-containing protein [Desulfobacterota bacterium AH_259_B03_O07]
MSPRTKATLYCGVGGAIVGAAAGAAIDKKKRGRGALVGGAIGAAAAMGACFAIASYRNTEVSDYKSTSQQVNYQPSSGDVVRITDFSLYPTAVRPGQKVAFNAQYYVMAPNPQQDITVTETRTIKGYDQKAETYTEMGSSSNQITMKPGTRRGDGVININNMTPHGNYLLELTVEYAGSRAEMEKPLIIGSPATTVAYKSTQGTNQSAKGTKEVLSREATSSSGIINQYFVATVATTSLRSGAGTTFKIVGQIRFRERYPILETIRNPGENYPWHRIRLDDGTEGWVSGIAGKAEQQ